MRKRFTVGMVAVSVVGMAVCLAIANANGPYGNATLGGKIGNIFVNTAPKKPSGLTVPLGFGASAQVVTYCRDAIQSLYTLCDLFDNLHSDLLITYNSIPPEYFAYSESGGVDVEESLEALLAQSNLLYQRALELDERLAEVNQIVLDGDPDEVALEMLDDLLVECEIMTTTGPYGFPHPLVHTLVLTAIALEDVINDIMQDGNLVELYSQVGVAFN